MAPTKRKGDLAELKVAAHLAELGYQLAFPYGEDSDFDLILIRGRELERVQVKHATSDGRVVEVSCRSLSLTHGKVKRIKRYTAETVDWIAVYDATTDLCLYVPSSMLGSGRSGISLRLAPTLNGQRALTHDAVQFRTPELDATLIP
ncbi:MAG: group I intron-associated PD-(D/E)XK endonuclease [Solirubrobacterales bacterium]